GGPEPDTRGEVESPRSVRPMSNIEARDHVPDNASPKLIESDTAEFGQDGLAIRTGIDVRVSCIQRHRLVRIEDQGPSARPAFHFVERSRALQGSQTRRGIQPEGNPPFAE